MNFVPSWRMIVNKRYERVFVVKGRLIYHVGCQSHMDIIPRVHPRKDRHANGTTTEGKQATNTKCHQDTWYGIILQ
jgi:hypothetical protein